MVFVVSTARGNDQQWEASSYLMVPVQLGSDTRLVMPEPFDDAWERDTDVSCSLLDDHTLIIRPRSAAIEQRLTLKGRQSGTLYLARVSSQLPYTPIVSIHLPARQDSPIKPRGAPTVLSLLSNMLQDNATGGFTVFQSQRVLLDEQGVRLTARQVWRSQPLSGIVADLTLTDDHLSFAVVPQRFDIHVPELGLLRAVSADRSTLDQSHPHTTIHLVFSHDPHSLP
jgi:hypothetical protein